MLSVRKFRESFPETNLSDEEAEKLIQQLYTLAELMLDSYIETRKPAGIKETSEDSKSGQSS